MTDAASTTAHPGQRLGLPATGPGSVARPGRRVLALIIDWAAASLVSTGFFHHDSWATLAVFVFEQWLLVATLGAGFGHALLGLRVRRLDGGAPGPWQALSRALALGVVLPAVVYDVDQRGLHDRWPGTVLVRHARA